MDNNSLPNSQEQHSGVRTRTRLIRRDKLESLCKCTLCNNICKEATTINECMHTFCKECIYRKLQAEGLTCCPVCNVDLSHLSPDDYLRPDEMWQNVIKSCFESSSRSNERRETPSPAIAVAASKSAAPADASDANKKRQKQLKKKTDKRGRRCQNKDDTGNVLEEASEGTTAGPEEDSSKFVKCTLLPQKDETGHVYPKLAVSEMQFDGDARVSTVKKLLKMELRLESEDEVGIYCLDNPVAESSTFSDMLNMWIDSMIRVPRWNLKHRKSDELELIYKRKKMPDALNEPAMSEESCT